MNPLPAIFAVLVMILIFLAAREIVCWYWKVNRAIELLESIDRKLGGGGAAS